jgi:hypothetical protein
MIEIEGRPFPGISLETSPFPGAGQFGSRAMAYYSKLYKKPENMVNIILKSLETGISGMQVVAYRPVVDAVPEGRCFFVSHSPNIFFTKSVRILAVRPQISCPL